MKSRIYSNFDIKGRWNGVVDYKSLAIVICVIFTIFSLANFFKFSFKLTFILICIFLPFASVLLFCNTKNEGSIDIIKNIISYYLTSKIYIKDYSNIKKAKHELSKIYINQSKLELLKENNKSSKVIDIIKKYINKIPKKIK